MDSDYLGFIRIWPGYTFVPDGYLPCDGRLLSINQYQALYALVGTLYGGDGHNTFGIPNLSGRDVIGAATGNGFNLPLGSTGGLASYTMTAATMPSHTHSFAPKVSLVATNGTGDSNEPGTGYSAATPGTDSYATGAPTAAMGAPVVNVTFGAAGQPAPAPVDNRSPYVATQYIICVNGIFPPQP